MRGLERFLLLQIIDQRWREHLYDMDYLREGIHLRGFAQIEPLVAYKNEAFELFRDLMNSIWADFARLIFHVEVTLEGDNGSGRRRQRSRPSAGSSSATGGGRVSYSGGGAPQPARWRWPRPPEPAAAEAEAGYDEEPRSARSSSAGSTRASRSAATIPCWCGSGKKFKKCHGA